MIQTTARAYGTLYIVATPIGNRQDITERAIHVLKTVDLIAAEDTRHARPFLELLGVHTKLVAFHAHNEAILAHQLIENLKQGQNIALVSDAGTPLIRDPGYPLVSVAHREQIRVVPVPGACALIAALSAAGVPSDMFTFAGFLPTTHAARQNTLQQFKSTLSHTLIFYESTHRIIPCLQDIQHVFGDSVALVLAKELTKTFETFVRGDVTQLLHWLTADVSRQKGEFVLMLLPPKKHSELAESERCLKILLKELPLKKAVQLTVALTGESRNAVYELALSLSR